MPTYRTGYGYLEPDYETPLLRGRLDAPEEHRTRRQVMPRQHRESRRAWAMARITSPAHAAFEKLRSGRVR